MYTAVLNAFDIKNETNNSIDTSNYSLIETTTHASKDVEKSFRLIISSDKWNKIKEKTVVHGNQKYTVLKPGK